MNKIAKDILFNPTHYTVAEIKTLIRKRKIMSEDVAKIIKDEAFELFEKLTSDDSLLPSVGIYEPNELSNIVVLWGARDSGKTSLIGSLLSLRGFKYVVKPDSLNFINRYGNNDDNSKGFLTRSFMSSGWQKMFCSTADGPIETIHTVYKQHWFSRSYPISFIEVNLTKSGSCTEEEKDLNWDYLIHSLKQNYGHIHLFCLDCNPNVNDSLDKALQRQITYFNHVISNLKINGLIDEASAIYIVVMKTDLMNAPEEFIENAAQTLVTSSLANFWQLVRNICYEKNIYNAQPVTSSIGRFALKDLAKLNTDYTRKIFHHQIIKKCQSRKLIIERWLDIKVWWLKWVVLFACIMGIIWGASTSLEILSGMPEDAVLPFDYGAFFKEEIKMGIRQEEYETARLKYHQLVYDLSTERKIQTNDGSQILSEELAGSLDSLLTVTFAPVLSESIKAFFETDTWSSQKVKCDHYKWDTKTLIDSKYLTDSQNKVFIDCRRYLNNLPKVLKYIRDSKSCTNMYDITIIKTDSSEWNIYPYKNDISLKDHLTNAVYNAYRSATNYCSVETSTKLTAYYRTVTEIYHRRLSDYDRDLAIYNEKIKLKNNSSWLMSCMEDIITQIPYADMKDELILSRNKINAIISEPVKPQKTIIQKVKDKWDQWF